MFFNQDVGATDKSEGTDPINPVAIAVPVVLLILIIPALLLAVFLYRRYVNIHWHVTVTQDYKGYAVELFDVL